MAKRRLLHPTQAEIEARRRKLPDFYPYDTQRLLADAKALAASQGMNLDAAVNVVRYANEKDQMVRLLTSLGYDPSDPDWQDVCFKLARLYCNVGRLAYNQPVGNSNARQWTPKAEFNLLMEVRRLTGEGLSERGAIKVLGENPAYDALFPHREQTPGRRGAKRRAPADELRVGSREERIADLRRPRVAALWKHYQRLRSTFSPDSLAHALGVNLHESDFELSLWLLNPPPLPPNPKS
jgi:hypothetical protein